MFTSGDRKSWITAVADAIMDGGANRPSVTDLLRIIPGQIVTGINDGHVTAAAAFGEARRGDCRAGQEIIINEMLGLLLEQGFVSQDNSGALRWLKPLDGTWQVKVGEREMTLFGRRERRMSRDRSMLGERTESDGSPIGAPGMFASGKSHPFEVEVIGPRGGRETQKLEVHPFALAIPPMTESERETLRASIESDGVKVPLVIFQKKVLDGRNRGYLASVLKKPVEIKEFIGTEEEARRHVAILNLHRRHLNAVQRGMAAVQLFGEEASQQTVEAVGGRPKKDGQKPPLKTATVSGPDRTKEWHAIVAREANNIGLKVTPSGIKALKEVMDAPETRAKAERGEYRSVADAHRDALIEKGKPSTNEIHAVSIGSVFKRLGQCIEHLNAILSDGQMPVGKLPEKISERLNEIERLVPKVRHALRSRRVIS